MGQHIAALVFEKPANKKFHRPTFGADVVQERLANTKVVV
jgi:hypothetical protein